MRTLLVLATSFFALGCFAATPLPPVLLSGSSTAGGGDLTVSSQIVSHGDSIVVMGSGFGSKRSSAPYLYDDGTGPSPWDDWQGTDIGYKDSGFRGVNSPHPRMTRYIAGKRGSNLNVFVIKNLAPDSYPTDIYGSYYVRFDPNWQSGTGSPGDSQFKPWTFGRNTWYDVPYAYIGCTNIRADGSNVTGQCGYGGSPGFPGGGGWGTSTANPIEGWIRMEYQLRLSDSSDGSHKFWEVSPLLPSGSVRVLSMNGATDFGGLPAQSYIMHGGYIRDMGENNWVYFSNLYMDFGMNRVVVTDNPVYEDATHREPQPYTSWSDSSITIEVNLGAVSGPNAYLFLVSENEIRGPVTLNIN